MRNKSISIATIFTAGSVAIVLIVLAISVNIAGYFFSRDSMSSFYGSAKTELMIFSDTITMFFKSKEAELNVFSDSPEVRAADESIHSFVDESGAVHILEYQKSHTEERIGPFASVLPLLTRILRRFTLVQNGAVMPPTLTVP